MLPATLLPSPAPGPDVGAVTARRAIDVVVPVLNEQRVLATVQQVGTPVGSVSGLHDLQGKAAELRASAA